MNVDEIICTMDRTARRRTDPISPPDDDDWQYMRATFGCEFSADYIEFINIAGQYWLPLELYDPIKPGRDSKNGTVTDIYEIERALQPTWDLNLIPFCGVGNGDLYCLAIRDGRAEEVAYVFHEDGHAERLFARFEDWINSLPQLLG